MAKKDTNRFNHYLNLEFGLLGKTVSTKENPNLSNQFKFWVRKGDDTLSLGNIVAVKESDGGITFGLIVELQSVLDIDSVLSDFVSHDFGDPDVMPPSEFSEVVVGKAQFLANTDNRVRPVGRGPVYYPSRKGIEYCLGMETYREENRAVPVGIFENGDGTWAPVYLDEDFLLGPEGAHYNISGISGLATKTSAVEFAMKSILTFTGEQRGQKIGIVAFNVKGKDLLYLDKPNPDLWKDTDLARRSRRIYELLEIRPEPFHNVRIFAPYDKRLKTHTKSIRKDGTVEAFIWDIPDIQDDIYTLFDREAWDDGVEAVWSDIIGVLEKQDILKHDQMMRWLNEERRAVADSRHQHWHGHAKHMFYKCVKNLDSLPVMYDGLVCTGGKEKVDIPIEELTHDSLFIIDLQSLNDRGQRLVFNKVMKKLSNLLLTRREGEGLDKIIVFVDELNKFAPRTADKYSAIKADLLDIAARGRSLGLILFGVEQFASEVDKQIVDNSSTILYGRSGHAELKDGIYDWLGTEMKARVTTLPRGELLLRHAKFTQAIYMKFPLPPNCPGDLYVPTAEEEITGFVDDDRFDVTTDFGRLAAKLDGPRALGAGDEKKKEGPRAWGTPETEETIDTED